jgi:hypothetical protein
MLDDREEPNVIPSSIAPGAVLEFSSFSFVYVAREGD